MKTFLKLLKFLKKLGFYLDWLYYKLLEDSSSMVFYIYNLFSFTVIILSSTLIILDLFDAIPPAIKPLAERLIDFATYLIIFEWTGRFILASDFTEDFEKAFFKYRSLKRALLEALKPKWQYVKSFYSVIDLLSVLYIFQPLRVLRVLALIRLFRLGFYRFILEGFIEVFKENLSRLVFLVILFSIFLTFMSLLIFTVEHKVNPKINTFFDAFYFTFISLTTVGYGDITPQTYAGRVIILLTVVGGVGLFSLFTAVLSSGFIEYLERIRKGMVEFKTLKNHIVICGWNETGRYIVKEIRRNPKLFKKHIVVITQQSEDNIPKECFIKYGDPTKEDILLSVNVAAADLAIILAEKKESLNEDTIDARTSLVALLVRSLSSKVFIIAEYLKEENAMAAKKRHLANKIIVAGEYLGKLIGKSVSQPQGIEVLEELFEGINLKIIRFGELSETPMTVEEILKRLGYLKIIGVYKGRKLILSPPLDLTLQRDDRIVLLDAEKSV